MEQSTDELGSDVRELPQQEDQEKPEPVKEKKTRGASKTAARAELAAFMERHGIRQGTAHGRTIYTAKERTSKKTLDKFRALLKKAR